MLLPYYNKDMVEAGCDEAGRGCLAGAVYAAAVILPPDFHNEQLNDSKQLTDRQRRALRTVIEREAVAWAVGVVSPEEIDRINILNASILAMHRAIDALRVRPQHLLIDGNRFRPYPGIPHTTVVKGDGKYLSIAAASILAKTCRDDYMLGPPRLRGDALSSPVVQSAGRRATEPGFRRVRWRHCLFVFIYYHLTRIFAVYPRPADRGLLSVWRCGLLCTAQKWKGRTVNVL